MIDIFMAVFMVVIIGSLAIVMLKSATSMKN